MSDEGLDYWRRRCQARPPCAKFRVRWKKKSRQCGVHVIFEKRKKMWCAGAAFRDKTRVARHLSLLCHSAVSFVRVCVDVPTMLAFSCSLAVPHGPDDGCPCPLALSIPPAALQREKDAARLPVFLATLSVPFPRPPALAGPRRRQWAGIVVACAFHEGDATRHCPVTSFSRFLRAHTCAPRR